MCAIETLIKYTNFLNRVRVIVCANPYNSRIEWFCWNWSCLLRGNAIAMTKMMKQMQEGVVLLKIAIIWSQFVHIFDHCDAESTSVVLVFLIFLSFLFAGNMICQCQRENFRRGSSRRRIYSIHRMQKKK